MPIDIYSFNLSNFCRSVLMTAKHLNIDLNVIEVDPGPEQWSPEFLKVNPNHNLPTLNDNGFVLVESRAIMQYLCNQYANKSSLYPKEPKARAQVDRWLFFDVTLNGSIANAVLRKPFTGVDPLPERVIAFKNNMKLLDESIGDNHYLTGNEHLTIADLAVLSSTAIFLNLGTDLSEYPKFKRWLTTLSQELPYFADINLKNFSPEKLQEWAKSSQKYINRKLNSA